MSKIADNAVLASEDIVTGNEEILKVGWLFSTYLLSHCLDLCITFEETLEVGWLFSAKFLSHLLDLCISFEETLEVWLALFSYTFISLDLCITFEEILKFGWLFSATLSTTLLSHCLDLCITFGKHLVVSKCTLGEVGSYRIFYLCCGYGKKEILHVNKRLMK